MRKIAASTGRDGGPRECKLHPYYYPITTYNSRKEGRMADRMKDHDRNDDLRSRDYMEAEEIAETHEREGMSAGERMPEERGMERGRSTDRNAGRDMRS